ncbi:MAG: hypothetical protein O2864_01500 [Crenarchaeota archaeon]|nr:hypothetical protein [Thermoproteota archaeon]
MSVNNKGVNPSFNDLITKYTNDEGVHFTKKLSAFLKKAYNVNAIDKRRFSRYDFPSLTQGDFRQFTHRLKNFVIKVIDSRPPFYKLRGLHVDNLTIDRTELGKVSKDFEDILSYLKHQPPFIHDIKISAHTEGLYENLIKTDHIPHKDNKQIIIKDFPINSRINTTATISRNGLLQIHLGCTFNPIPYSISGWNEVIEILGVVKFILRARSKTEFNVNPISEWVVTYYHFNRDGVIIDSLKDHYSIASLQEHSQIYVKKLKEKTVLRWEEKRTPNTTIAQEQDLSAEEEFDVEFKTARDLYHG